MLNRTSSIFFQLYTEQCRAVKERETLTEVSRGQRRSAGARRGQPGPEKVNRGRRRSAGVHGGQPGSTEVSRGQRRSAGVHGGQPGSTEVSRGQRRSAGVNGGQPRPEEVNRSHPSGHKISMEKCFLCFEPASIPCLHCRQGSGNVHLILVYLF